MPPSTCVRRLQRELRHIQEDGGVSPTVHIAARDDDITKLDALIFGPPDTPYDGGVLHFQLKVPPDYPLKPPDVRFMNTDGKTLRIHPQLYAEGKVCLSILGTWHGPRWTASHGLRLLLLSLQSLLNEEPLRCEPGLEHASQDAVDRANVFVVHETVRVLTLGALTEPSWGRSESVETLTAAARAYVAERREAVLKRLRELTKLANGQLVRDPFTFSGVAGSRRYDFKSLASRLEEALDAAHGSPRPPCATPGVDGEGSEQQDGDSSTGEEQSEEARCRICHMDEEESEEKLLRPCFCSGSIQYAHSGCVVQWLQFHGAIHAAAEWRCDVCGAKFKVRLGASSPAGLSYLKRPLLSLESEEAFEGRGLVYVLLVSMLQVLLTTLGHVLAGGLHYCVELAWWPLPLVLPSRFCNAVWGILLVPAVLVDLATTLLYWVLIVLKAAVAWAGADWTPGQWGEYSENYLGLSLQIIIDNLGFQLGMRLLGLVVVASYVTGIRLLAIGAGCDRSHYGVYGWAFGAGAPAPAPAEPSFAAWRSFLPAGVTNAAAELQQTMTVISMLVNAFAILSLLKRAFWDGRPVLAEVLEARGRPPKAARQAKRPRQEEPSAGRRGAAEAGDDDGEPKQQRLSRRSRKPAEQEAEDAVF